VPGLGLPGLSGVRVHLYRLTGWIMATVREVGVARHGSRRRGRLPVEPLVDLVVASDEEFCRVAVHWPGGVRTVAPLLWQRQQETAPLPAIMRGGWVPEDRIGPPGGGYATLTVVFRPWRGKLKVKSYSERTGPGWSVSSRVARWKRPRRWISWTRTAGTGTAAASGRGFRPRTTSLTGCS
jgi:hypothetical protein